MDAVFNNSVPIYLQIVSEIKKQIVSGKLIPGERIPSVRELALTYKVNPNTMQKALIELEENGLIKTERTNGKFVTEDENIINKIKNDYADNLTQNYLSEMISLGITKQEIKTMKDLKKHIEQNNIITIEIIIIYLNVLIIFLFQVILI